MKIGLVGKKIGMTRLFLEDGESVPVTVIKVADNRILDVKKQSRDGYSSIVVAYGVSKANKINKAERGIYSKSQVGGGEGIREFRISAEDENNYEVGAENKVEILKDADYVDVTGKSIGKGFQGVIKRWNFSMQDATHGNSLSHRAPGSIGQNQSPGRVFKGKKMAGHMGNEKVTVQNLKLVKVDVENQVLLVKGAVPGSKGSVVVIRPSIKK